MKLSVIAHFVGFLVAISYLESTTESRIIASTSLHAGAVPAISTIVSYVNTLQLKEANLLNIKQK